jgi:Ca2+-binding EF-hand superfamily protein
MKPMSRHCLLVALLALLPAAAADAQAAKDAPPAAAAAETPSHSDAFDETDTNHDGVITREEYLAFTRKYFDELDTNHDHRIDASEMAHSPPMIERNLHSAEQMIRKWDANKDGVVTVEEYQAFAAARFTKEDKNGTGKIAKPEPRAKRNPPEIQPVPAKPKS